jgi:cytochrome c oxidase cbb3-type subunit 2
MAMFIALAVSFGGLAEIVPLMYQAEAIEPLPGVKPYPALELAGRDVYVREGCYNCHSQMVRTLRFETERYGHYSLAGESVYDRPVPVGQQAHRAGPGTRRRPLLGRLASRAPEQPARRGARVEHAVFPWLAKNKPIRPTVQAHMRALKRLGDPYTDAEIDGAPPRSRARPNWTRWSPTCRASASMSVRATHRIRGRPPRLQP